MTAATASLSSEAISVAPNSTPRMPLITITIRYITSTAPNVGHQRPFTSRNERPSAATGPSPSDSSAGKPTDHATASQMPGRISRMNAGIRPIVNRIERTISGTELARRERERLAHRRLLAQVDARHRAEARGGRERRQHEAQHRRQQRAGQGGARAHVAGRRRRVEVERVVARRRRDQRVDDVQRQRHDEHAARRACRSSDRTTLNDASSTSPTLRGRSCGAN